MRNFAVAAAMVLLTAGSSLGACYEGIGCTDDDKFRRADLREFSCQILWDLRNTIYQENGYCFQTTRAKQYFGNKGCSITNQSKVKLNAIEKYNVGQIGAVEDERGC